MWSLKKASFCLVVCFLLVSCRAPAPTGKSFAPAQHAPIQETTAIAAPSGNSLGPAQHAEARRRTPEIDANDLPPLIPKAQRVISDALVIVVPDDAVHQSGTAFKARSEWSEVLRAAFEERESFSSVVLARTDTSNTVQRVASTTTNASILFLADIPAEPGGGAAWMYMQNGWLADMRTANGWPVAILGKLDDVKSPYGRRAELLFWIERVEFLARLPNYSHALAFSVVQQKPKKTGKYRVFQSLQGYSLCDRGLGSDERFCVEGLGRPFIADNTWFEVDPVVKTTRRDC